MSLVLRRAAYSAITALLRLRERMRPYIHRQLDAGRRTECADAAPAPRIPRRSRAWDVEDEFMFGPLVLVHRSPN